MLFLLAGCSSAPLSTAIVGDWDVHCATDDPSDRECLGQDPMSIRKSFRRDGSIALTAVDRPGDVPMIGTWTVTGDQLDVRFEGGGLTLDERYVGRVEGDRLILWMPDRGFGSILQRVGTTPAPAAGAGSDGAPVTGTLEGVGYSLALPAGSRKVRDDNGRQAWAVPGGFRVDLAVTPRSTGSGGELIPCDPQEGGITTAGQTIDGVERDTSIGRSRCLPPGAVGFSCGVSHERGWLESAEKEAAIALCSGLTL